MERDKRWTNDSSEHGKDQFYYSLKTVVEGYPTRDVMGDLNAKIGIENAGLEIYGKTWMWQMN